MSFTFISTGYDDKKLLETRIRDAMSDVGERLTRVAVAPASSAIAKRQNIATKLQSVSSLVEEMLTMAKQSYSAALTASHMVGHLAYELNVTTIVQLRRRIDDLQKEVRSWVFLRSSQDSTAAMILAEENRERRFGKGQWRAFCENAPA
jgi:hypothetical protein